MTSNLTHRPVDCDWKQALNQRFDILHFGIRQRDSQLLATIIAQDQSTAIDWLATFYDRAKALGPGVLDDSSAVMKILENRCREANTNIKGEATEVEQNMRTLAGGKDSTDTLAWKLCINTNIDRLKTSADKEFEDLKAFGLREIGKLRPDLQNLAAHVFNGASNGVSGFFKNCIDWLKDAFKSIGSWIEHAWAKVTEFADDAKQWFRGAEALIIAWFHPHGAVRGVSPLSHYVRDVHGGIEDMENLSAITNLAGKLQCMDVESFMIVRKGHGWALEIDSP